MPIEEKVFLSLLKNIKNFEKKPHIAVGVSGGPDSMLLTYLLLKWIKLKKGKLTALVFDHNIRSNSKNESYKVKKMLSNYNVETFIIRPKKNKLIKKNMEDARINRFEGLISFCKKNNILHLFLGHHFDDNLETFLIRKINGSNLEGLASMNFVSYFNNIQILRPLLLSKKISILNFNKKNKIKFINDPSNNDVNYTRVKVRNYLLNKSDKKIVLSDFLKLKKQIPNYKTMIWELLINSLEEIQSNRIKINYNKLIKLDNMIIERHILLLVKFLKNKKNQTKSSKINNFINLMKKSNFKIFNLSGVIIQKNSDFLVFSQK